SRGETAVVGNARSATVCASEELVAFLIRYHLFPLGECLTHADRHPILYRHDSVCAITSLALHARNAHDLRGDGSKGRHRYRRHYAAAYQRAFEPNSLHRHARPWRRLG